jgi:hypothetical protein
LGHDGPGIAHDSKSRAPPKSIGKDMNTYGPWSLASPCTFYAGDAEQKIIINAAFRFEFPETSPTTSAAPMFAPALPIDTATPVATALPAVRAPPAAQAHKSMKHGKNKRRKSKKQKKSSSSSSNSQSSSISIAVAPTPMDRMPLFYKRSALPNSSGTYRMLPIAVLKEILHVISPEMCPRDEKQAAPRRTFCYQPEKSFDVLCF